jgi:hypothetical protein
MRDKQKARHVAAEVNHKALRKRDTSTQGGPARGPSGPNGALQAVLVSIKFVNLCDAHSIAGVRREKVSCPTA